MAVQRSGVDGNESPEAERRAREEQFRLLFDHSPDAMFLIDPYGPDGSWLIVDCNPAACAMNGYARDELIGQDIGLLDSAPVDAAARQAYIERLQREGTMQGETVHRRKDGSEVPIEFSLSLIPVGDRPLLLGLDRDVTERKRAEERLQFLAEASAVLASSLEYATTLAHVGEVAVPRIADWCSINVVDAEGRLVRVVGRHIDPSKEARLREIRERYTPNLLPAAPPIGAAYGGQAQLIPEVTEAHLTALAQNEEQLRVYREMGFQSGMIVPLYAGARLLGIMILATAESSRRYGPHDVAVAEDLAHRAAQAIEHARLYEAAQRAIHLRDEFLSIAAHELKTPVTSLMGYTQVLQRRFVRTGNVSERDQRAVGVIAEQAERLGRLIALLLDVSRIETGHLRMEQQPVDLGALGRRVVEQMQPHLERHTLHYQATGEPLVVLGDELRLEQVLQNLLENAVKYSPTGGHVSLLAERRDDQVMLAVADRGIGIPRLAQPHLFQRFYRASNVDATHIAGLGIGLYLVNEIVTRHGGRVEVQSQEGRGSTFTVWLPAMPDTPPC